MEEKKKKKKKIKKLVNHVNYEEKEDPYYIDKVPIPDPHTKSNMSPLSTWPLTTRKSEKIVNDEACTNLNMCTVKASSHVENGSE